LRVLVVTQGERGSACFTADGSVAVPAFTVNAIDTTGAGDGFVAGFLSALLAHDLTWDLGILEAALRLGNAVGGLTCTQRGAIPALPSRAAVEAFLAAQVLDLT
jgi:sugar/nucleoside kinase (ribokinase family)